MAAMGRTYPQAGAEWSKLPPRGFGEFAGKYGHMTEAPLPHSQILDERRGACFDPGTD